MHVNTWKKSAEKFFDIMTNYQPDTDWACYPCQTRQGMAGEIWMNEVEGVDTWTMNFYETDQFNNPIYNSEGEVVITNLCFLFFKNTIELMYEGHCLAELTDVTLTKFIMIVDSLIIDDYKVYDVSNNYSLTGDYDDDTDEYQLFYKGHPSQNHFNL